MRTDYRAVKKRIQEARGLLEKADLNNELAVTVMGWHLKSGDDKNVWHDSEDNPVQIDLGYPLGRVTLCAHPWNESVHTIEHMSFNPTLNHNRNIIDFDAMLKSALRW